MLGRPPGSPASCQGRYRPSSAFSWSIGDGGDPAELVTSYLSEGGLPVRELGRTANLFHPVGLGTVCGAALYVSAAAGSVMIGGPPGAPSPVPGIPDVVAVLYVHTDDRPGRPPTRAAVPPWRLGGWWESWSRTDHAAAVDGVRAAIGRGDVYQVNVVGHASAPYTGDPRPALARVAGLPGARYGGVLAGDGWAVATASPETLVELRDGRVITRPIKGTRPATGAGRRELLASAKERAEHVMIVDLERNDLSRLPGAGPVRVDELFAVRRWCDLWQAESVVSAPLVAGVGLADLLRAVCPGGSVTGAPKRAALDEIARWEPVGRGVSMGALGWVGTDHVDLGLSIRTVAVDGARVHVWAGGGITWGSDPAAEVDEAAAKAAPLRAAVAG
ncbi:MAG TPA: chorismate-binding protein [Actinoplanes sp.]|nr:chorismate-binding protein [Actinoplanes sp.]